MDILNNINKNPTAYANVQTPSINNSDGQYHEQINSDQKEAKEKEQCVKRTDISYKEGTCIPGDNKTVLQGSEVLKTRSGQVVKKNRQISIHLATSASPANTLATPTNVIWPTG